MNEIFSVWFLIGAALVFWMQAGFAMVEAGFTRAKNTGNILMKNLMDFCIGTVVFIAVGFGLGTATDGAGHSVLLLVDLGILVAVAGGTDDLLGKGHGTADFTVLSFRPTTGSASGSH